MATNVPLQGTYQLTCSRAVEKSGGPVAALFKSRADRLWRHRGNVLAMIEAESYGGPPLEIRDYDKDPRFAHTSEPGTLTLDASCAPAAVLDTIANAFDLASSPALLGAELRQLIATLGCGSFASVRETTRPLSEDDVSGPAIQLGQEGKRTVVLTYGAGDTPEQSVLIADVARLTRAALALDRLRREENARAAVWPMPDRGSDDPVFVDEQMVSLIAAARRVAPVNVSVLITGETGTGKEVVARAVHAASSRARGVFMPFNCAACPREMIDAQLFGHRRGAFTGAMENAPGVIRAASAGTLFLDEIGEAPIEVQPKLLRFLEAGEIHPIGEAHPLKVDVRVIAATNVDLDAMVSAGRFREDLFYRLNIVRLHVPPLRERRVEIPVLAQHYLRKYAKEFAKGDVRLAEETVEYLLLYRWPGNVRQLANELRRLVAMAEPDAVLMPEHLTPEIASSRRTVPPSERQIDDNEVVVRSDQPLAAAVEHLERVMVLRALKACGGHMEETARRLGLSRKGLYLKRQRFGLDVSDEEARSA